MEHVQALFFFLEENVNGSFTDKVLPEFRAELSLEQRSQVLRAKGHLDLPVTLSAMRFLMITNLITEPVPSANINLRDYLDYVEVKDGDVDYISELEWYDKNFPHSLTLGTCLAAFSILLGSSLSQDARGQPAPLPSAPPRPDNPNPFR